MLLDNKYRCLCPLKGSRWTWNFNVLNWCVKLNIFYHLPLFRDGIKTSWISLQSMLDRPAFRRNYMYSPLPEENGMWLNFCDNIIVIPSRILQWNCSSVQSGESLCCSVMLNPHHAAIGIYTWYPPYTGWRTKNRPAGRLVDQRGRRSGTLYRKLNKCKCKVLTA